MKAYFMISVGFIENGFLMQILVFEKSLTNGFIRKNCFLMMRSKNYTPKKQLLYLRVEQNYLL